MSQLYRAKFDRPSLPTFLKGAWSASGMWRKAVLTFPCTDLAGDYVEPSGLNFDSHRSDPSIDLEHGRDPKYRGMPVAWARESLSQPGAPYAVEYVSLNVAAEGQPPEYHDLPVGTNYFDKSCRVSSQVFALVEQDALPAVSLEFRAVPGFMKSLGRSPLENRDAFRFDRADVLRWTLCARGVNEGALTVTKSATAREQVPAPLAKILSDGWVNVGGVREPLCEVILKALSPTASPRRTTVRVEKAAMHMTPAAPAQPTAQPTPTDDLDPSIEGAMEEESPPSGGVAAKYAFVQAVAEALESYKRDMQSSDHPGLRAKADQDIDAFGALLAKIKGRADKHDSLLNGGGSPEDMDDDGEGEDLEDADADDTDDAPEEGDDTEDSDAPEEDDAEKPKKKGGPPWKKAVARDDDGVLADVREVYRKSLYQRAVKRFSVGDLPPPRPVKKAPPKKAEPSEDPAQLAALRAELDGLKKQLSYR